MSDSDQLVELYEKLFSVGTLERNILLYIITYVIFSVEIYFISSSIYEYELAFLSIPILSLLYSKIFIRFILSKRDNKFYCIRRLLALHIIENIILIIVVGIGWGLSLYTGNISSIIYLPLLVIPIYESIVFLPTLYNGDRNGNILVISKTILLGLIIYPLITNPIKLFTSTISGIIIGNTVMYLINVYSRKYLEEGAYEYLRGYIDSWLLNDPTKLDELLYKNSLLIKTPIDVIIFPETFRRPSQIIIPYFHFGPFKNVGSSRFPSYTSEKMYLEKGFITAVLHGPSTHDRDLASNNEMENISIKIGEYKDPYIFKKISDIMELSDSDATAKYIRLDDAILIFLEYNLMEDIPYSMVERLRRKGMELGYKHVIVVDSHNSLINKRYKMKEEDIEKISNIALKALEEGMKIDLQPFKINMEKIEIPEISLKEGLGRNGITVLIFETMKNKNGIIIIDSNNLSPELKKRIEETALNFLDKVIIATTDTHEVTALGVIEGGYNILGEEEKISHNILEKVSICIKKTLEKLSKSDGHIYAYKIDTRVIGYNLIEKLGNMTLKTYKYTMKILKYLTMPITLLAIIILSLI